MHGAVPPLPQYSFVVWCLVTAQGQLYFYLIISFRYKEENILEIIKELILMMCRVHSLIICSSHCSNFETLFGYTVGAE